jgi:hypothetical protein
MVDWNQPLSRVLILKTGERLRTLHDAAELITRRFGSVTKSAPLEHAIGLLLRAAEIRRGLIQLAWRFLRFQKDSAVVQWDRARTQAPEGARKTTMITALARKVLMTC